MTEYAFEGAKRASTTVSWSFESQTYPADAAYPFSSAIGAVYQSTIEAAFARWSAVSGLTFVQVADQASAGIRVGFGTFSSPYYVGQTLVRAPYGTLSNDTIVRLLDPNVQPLAPDGQGNWNYGDWGVTLYQVAVHEIGHALGLDHTTDPLTIMYPTATTRNTDLALGDIEGINTLYPLYTVADARPVQVEATAGSVGFHFTLTRYSDPAAALTIGYSVAGAASPDLAGSVAASAATFGGAMPSGNVTFAAGSSTADLTIVVPASTTPGPDQGLTLTLSSLTPGTSATTRGVVQAVLLDANGYSPVASGALGIYRFFDRANGTQFLTGSEVERNAILTTRADLSYEGVDLTSVAAPASDPAAVAVYRFFDKTYGTHFFTASTAERDAVLATRSDLSLEGVAFYEDAASQPGDTAVYRFLDTAKGTHFYTSSAVERAAVLATRPDLTAEGVAFYAPSSA